MAEIASKICTKCRESLPLSAFYRSKSRTDNHTYRYKTCLNGNNKCPSCGIQITRRSKTCRACNKSGEMNPHWRGGRLTRGIGGYVRIKDHDHPNAHADGYVLEHIKVMSESISRPLRPEETVHHKNGVRDDNRPGNLELWSSSHPPGQRAEDLLSWAREILDLYG